MVGNQSEEVVNGILELGKEVDRLQAENVVLLNGIKLARIELNHQPADLVNSDSVCIYLDNAITAAPETAELQKFIEAAKHAESLCKDIKYVDSPLREIIEAYREWRK